MAHERCHELVVAHIRVIALGRVAGFGNEGVAELLIEFGNDVFPLLFGVFARVHVHIFVEFFVEQAVKIDELFHILTRIVLFLMYARGVTSCN